MRICADPDTKHCVFRFKIKLLKFFFVILDLLVLRRFVLYNEGKPTEIQASILSRHRDADSVRSLGQIRLYRKMTIRSGSYSNIETKQNKTKNVAYQYILQKSSLITI